VVLPDFLRLCCLENSRTVPQKGGKREPVHLTAHLRCWGARAVEAALPEIICKRDFFFDKLRLSPSDRSLSAAEAGRKKTGLSLRSSEV